MAVIFVSTLEQLARTNSKSLISTFLSKNDAQHKDQKLEYLDMGDEGDQPAKTQGNQQQHQPQAATIKSEDNDNED